MVMNIAPILIQERFMVELGSLILSLDHTIFTGLLFTLGQEDS